MGCALDVGRPPLCYEFFCSRILSSFEGVYQRYGLQVLGRLMSYVGDDALFRGHLVMLNEPEELFNISFGKIYKRIIKARGALEDCIALITHDSAGNSMLRNLKTIHRLPKELS